METEQLLRQLTIEEKAALVAGTEFMFTNPVPRLGIKSLRMSDGPHGLRVQADDAVRQLSRDVGIPADLKGIVKEEDIDFLAQSAMDDACRPGNPKDPVKEVITALYKSLI